MKKTILSLALLAACTLAFANNSSSPKDHHDGHGHHGPKTPDVKTPPTKPDTSGPKTTPSPAPAARSTPTRSEGTRDADNLCTRWPTMFFCDKP